MTYYNENDLPTAEWLKNLGSAGLIPDGRVDERSIRDVRGADVRDYEQCHFFAGVGGWPYALELAGWYGPVWTGSCPCQPFSNAGKRRGTADERHLWPEFLRLIVECRPATVFGEQVASPDGRKWLAGVRSDLEALGYAVGCADLCAAGVGAPHIRHRLYWVAQPRSVTEREPRGELSSVSSRGATGQDARLGGESGRAGDTPKLHGPSCDVHGRGDSEGTRMLPESGDPGSTPQRLGNNNKQGSQGWSVSGGGRSGELSPWSPSHVVQCTDGWRRVEPGTQPMVDGVSGRVVKLRAYGNAIVPQVAAKFVRAFMECR